MATGGYGMGSANSYANPPAQAGPGFGGAATTAYRNSPLYAQASEAKSRLLAKGAGLLAAGLALPGVGLAVPVAAALLPAVAGAFKEYSRVDIGGRHLEGREASALVQQYGGVFRFTKALASGQVA